MTARSIGEMFWGIGWEPHFEARKTEKNDGNNEYVESVIDTSSTSTGASTEPYRVALEN